MPVGWDTHQLYFICWLFAAQSKPVGSELCTLMYLDLDVLAVC